MANTRTNKHETGKCCGFHNHLRSDRSYSKTGNLKVSNMGQQDIPVERLIILKTCEHRQSAECGNAEIMMNDVN